MVKGVLKFNHASFGHQGMALIDKLHLELPESSLIAIIGRNGTGKSTLIKTVCGQLPLVSGSIHVGETDLGTLEPATHAKVVSAVFTGRLSGFQLTPYDIVASARMPYTSWANQLSQQDKQKIDNALETYGVQSFARQPISNLSDGMYQRVMLARAVAQETPVMVLDEPTAFLDYGSRHEVFGLLKSLSKTGKTILISTHDLDLVLKYCDYVMMLGVSKVNLYTSQTIRQLPEFLSLGGNYL